MSDTSKQERIDELLAKFDRALEANESQKATDVLKEAVLLDPNNKAVNTRWLSIANGTGDASIVALLTRYYKSGDDGDGMAALAAAKSTKSFPTHVAQAALDSLLATDRKLPLLDQLLAALITHNLEVRQYAAARLGVDAAKLLEVCLTTGDASFAAVTFLPMDGTLWTSKDVQADAQAEAFRLLLSFLGRDLCQNVPNRESVLRAIARQLDKGSENVTKLLENQDSFNSIMRGLDIRLPVGLRGQAMLCASKWLESTKAKGDIMLVHFVSERVVQQPIIAFSAAASVFPIVTAVAVKLFLTEGFLPQLVSQLEAPIIAEAEEHRAALEQAALTLLSASCIDNSCREAIRHHCSQWLERLVQETDAANGALATLVQAKISENGKDLATITRSLVQFTVTAGEGTDDQQQAIEGLAYSSLQPAVKEAMSSDSRLLHHLVLALQTQSASTLGCLTIFANMTAYTPVQTEEQKKLTQLKAYANANAAAVSTKVDMLETDNKVSLRCKKLLAAELIPALVSYGRTMTSSTNMGLLTAILLAMAKEQKNRAKMTQQGAVKLLFQIRERTNKAFELEAQRAIQFTAAHALARLLISTNPQHVFTANLPASTAVSVLVPLLNPDSSSSDNARNLLPTFEALLALTNLASLPPDSGVAELIIRLAWSYIEDLLFSPTVMVQRATAELLCNLSISPFLVEKVADGSPDAKRRLQILLALTDVEDMATRRAIGGAFASLTEWDVAVAAILDAKNGKGIEALLSSCSDESSEVRVRAVVSIGNIAGAPSDMGVQGRRALMEHDGMASLMRCTKNTNDAQVLTMIMAILTQLQAS